MPSGRKFPLALFVVLTALPATLIGGAIWWLAGALPGCELSERERLASPDGRYDLVIFSRDCGATTGLNSQAALIPAGDALPEDAASFLSVSTIAALDPAWTESGTIALTVPGDVKIYRQDGEVAGITVSYR